MSLLDWIKRPPRQKAPKSMLDEAVRAHEEAKQKHAKSAHDLDDTLTNFQRTGQFKLRELAKRERELGN